MNLLAIAVRMLLVFSVVWIVATVGGYSLIVSLSKPRAAVEPYRRGE
jgi:hypothetical protein